MLSTDLMFFVGSVSFVQLLVGADVVIKMVIAIMVVLSVLIWAVLFEKLYVFRQIAEKANIFEKQFWSGITLEDFYEKNRAKLKHPIGQVFSCTMQEWLASEANKSIASIELIKGGVKERMALALDANLIKINGSLNKYMGFLGFTASISPFIGLFGTVWGIMSSFRSIADAGNANLAAVAPGVAEALITTAIGILIAICATAIHAYLEQRVLRILEQINGFGTDMLNILSRELDSFSIKKNNQNASHEA